ncbi:MAG: chromate transporter [Bacillota bacterium]|nr:chromate transporter [Bacillota bacterium]
MKENKHPISLLELFITFFKINSITFGGGYTIVPIIIDELANKKNIITEEEMLDLQAIAQSGPGAMAINTSILTGFRLRGPIGALVCLAASVLPCIIIITIISYFYQEFKENYFINAALKGMAGIIAGVLVITTIRMAKNATKERASFSFLIMIIAFLASFVFHINTGLIILISAIFGLVIFSIKKEGEQTNDIN